MEENTPGLSVDDLILVIGEQSVEIRVLKNLLAQANAKLEELTAENNQDTNKE